MNALVDTIWSIALAAAVPIAAVVGFALQLHQIRRVRLDHDKLLLEILELKRKQRDEELLKEKLLLEIGQLQRASDNAESRVVVATQSEVLKYANLNERGSFCRWKDEDGTIEFSESFLSELKDGLPKVLLVGVAVSILFFLLVFLLRILLVG